MKRFLFWAVCAAALAVPCCPDGYGSLQRSYAGWGGGGCGFGGAPVMPAVAGFVNIWEWRQIDADEWALMRYGWQYGNYRLTDQAFLIRIGLDQWQRANPPVALPVAVIEELARRQRITQAEAGDKKDCHCCKDCKCGKDCKCEYGRRCGKGCKCQRGQEEAEELPLPVENFGVDMGRVGQSGERYQLDGRTVSAGQAKRAIIKPPAGGVELPDDSAKLSLTLIGSEADCQKALADLQAPDNAELRDHCIVQCYRPDDVMISAKYWGGPTDGNPRVYLQRPAGEVLWSEAYAGPKMWSNVRKADPLHDNSKDPGPNRPGPSSPGGGLHIPPETLTLVAFVGLGVVVALTLAMRQKKAS